MFAFCYLFVNYLKKEKRKEKRRKGIQEMDEDQQRPNTVRSLHVDVKKEKEKKER